MPELPCTCAYSTVDRTPPARDLGGDEDDKPVCKAFRRRSELASVKAIACTIWVELSGEGAGSRALCWAMDHASNPKPGTRTPTVHLVSFRIQYRRSSGTQRVCTLWGKRAKYLGKEKASSVYCKWRWKNVGIKFVCRPSYSSGIFTFPAVCY
jgi:hypothetical protein